MKQTLYILYGSQTGNAQEISREIYDLLDKKFSGIIHSYVVPDSSKNHAQAHDFC